MESKTELTSQIKTCADLRAALADYYGTENYYVLPYADDCFIARFVMRYTDGVRKMAQLTEGYWLLDALQSLMPKIKCNIYTREFALVRLTVEDTRGTLDILPDSDAEPKFRQIIPFTDFPEGTFEMYLENGVLLLPREH